MSAEIRAVTVQFSHPDDDCDTARMLREEGLTPLMINGAFIAGTTEDHLQQALDGVKARMAGESVQQATAYRTSVVEALAAALEASDHDLPETLPDDALLLLAEGLVMNGYDDADQLPFCAVQFARDAVDRPVFALRPGDEPAGRT